MSARPLQFGDARLEALELQSLRIEQTADSLRRALQGGEVQEVLARLSVQLQSIRPALNRLYWRQFLPGADQVDVGRGASQPVGQVLLEQAKFVHSRLQKMPEIVHEDPQMSQDAIAAQPDTKPEPANCCWCGGPTYLMPVLRITMVDDQPVHYQVECTECGARGPVECTESLALLAWESLVSVGQLPG